MTDPYHAQRQETAAVVLYWMQRRGLTRQVFADRMGKSMSWVDKIRAGIVSLTACRPYAGSQVCWTFHCPCSSTPKKQNVDGPLDGVSGRQLPGHRPTSS
jgi:hypothetical protein